jgi:predicted  nucleic acid-binding Zn-ribbon protein
VALDYELLRSLHHLLKQRTNLRSRLEKGPRKIKVVSANEVSFLAEKDSAKENVTKTKMASNAKQLQLNEREAKIEELNGKLNSCESNKEFQLLKDRIAADNQANSVLQDEILEQLEKLDTLIAEAETSKLNYEKAQNETKKITDQVESELKQLESELSRVSQELEEAIKRVPDDLKIQFKRLVEGKGEDALAETDTETCGNCNQRLTIQTGAELMMKQAIFCKGCGCLLYLAAGHPASQH